MRVPVAGGLAAWVWSWAAYALHFEARPIATACAPVDPLTVIGPHPLSPAVRTLHALSEIGDPR